MNLYLRLLLTLVRARLGTAISPLDVSRAAYRVWPHDLDLNLHMNNGRYATLMDLGRIDLMARAGVLARIARARLMPVVTSQHLTYRRSLAPFERFTIETRVLGWDERNVYLEQVFVRADGEVAARGLAQTLFLKGGRRVPSDEVAGMLAMGPAMAVPDAVLSVFPGSSRAGA